MTSRPAGGPDAPRPGENAPTTARWSAGERLALVLVIGLAAAVVLAVVAAVLFFVAVGHLSVGW